MSGAAPRLGLLGFRPGPGGVGRVMTNLIGGLLERDLAVDLLLPPGEHPDLAPLDGRDGLWRFPLDADRPQTAAGELRAYLDAARPAALLSNKDQTNALLSRNRLGPGRPCTVFRVGTNLPAKLRQQGALMAWYRQRQLARVLAEADALLGISPGVTEALERLLNSVAGSDDRRPALTTVWNPVDRAAVLTQSRAARAHRWLGQPEMPVIVSVGRLVKAKNYELLIRAFARLRAEQPCRLVICGEGRQRRRLARLASRLGVAGDLDLVGHLPNPFPLMAQADLFVVSSLFEGANNALMEAVTLGTPCVSTDCPSGPREILEEGALGPLVPVNDTRALAAAMAATLRAPPARETLRASAARFDLRRSVQGYLDVLGLGDLG
jgi:glycosyltransferase involved in cell wall biosynthesis